MAIAGHTSSSTRRAARNKDAPWGRNSPPPVERRGVPPGVDPRRRWRSPGDRRVLTSGILRDRQIRAPPDGRVDSLRTLIGSSRHPTPTRDRWPEVMRLQTVPAARRRGRKGPRTAAAALEGSAPRRPRLTSRDLDGRRQARMSLGDELATATPEAIQQIIACSWSASRRPTVRWSAGCRPDRLSRSSTPRCCHRGAPGRTRTADAGLRTASLYPLSYGGAADIVLRALGGNLRTTSRRQRSQAAAPPCGGLSSPAPQATPTYNPRTPWPTLPSPTSSCTAAPSAACATRHATSSARSSTSARARGLPTRPRRASTSTSTPTSSAAFFDTIPVVELGDRRLELVTSAAKLRRLLATSSTGARRRPGMTSGTDLTILVALAAGLISFLSPCVLPLVPAYLGQLTAIAVAGARRWRPTRSRWLAVRHAFAFVAGLRGGVHAPRRDRDVRWRRASSTTCRAPRRSAAWS